MNDRLEKLNQEFKKRRRRKRRWNVLISALAGITVLTTSYALILPAITMEHRPEELAAATLPESMEAGTEAESGDAVSAETAGEASVGAGEASEEPGSSLPEEPSGEAGVGSQPEASSGEAEVGSQPETPAGEPEAGGQTGAAGGAAGAGNLPETPPGELPATEESAEAFEDTPHEEELLPEIPEEEELTETETEPESDPEADVEERSQWEATFAQVTLSGDWAEDVLAIAGTQLGYEESRRNFVRVDGENRGYTRYGDWYGDPYGEWCAMFVSFCLHYAEVDPSLMPQGASCQGWADELDAAGLLRGTDYVPEPGDLVFFDRSGDGSCDHVGLISGTSGDDESPSELWVIEGNAGGAVRERRYERSAGEITGYGELPDNPDQKNEDEAEENGGATGDEKEIMLRAETEDGITVVMTAPASSFDCPAEELSLSAAVIEDKEAKALIEKEASGDDGKNTRRKSVLFDIKLLRNGEEVEPAGPVSLSFDGIDTPKNDAQVYHVDEAEKKVEEVTAPGQQDDVITAETDHFSVYGVTFTVDFHYGEHSYSISGLSLIRLSELFGKLHMDCDIHDVESVEFSDPDLVDVQEFTMEDGTKNWVLTSLAPFLTEETLTITLKDGEVIIVHVTDNVVTGGYVANFQNNMPLCSARICSWNCHTGNITAASTWGICRRSGSNFYLAGSWTSKKKYGAQIWNVSGGFTVTFANGIQLNDGSYRPLTMSVSASRICVGGYNRTARDVSIFNYNQLCAKSGVSVNVDMNVSFSSPVAQSMCYGFTGIDKYGTVTEYNAWLPPSTATWDFLEDVRWTSGLWNGNLYRPSTTQITAVSGTEVKYTNSNVPTASGDSNYNYGFTAPVNSAGFSYYYAAHDTYSQPFQRFYAIGYISRYKTYNGTSWINGTKGGRLDIRDSTGGVLQNTGSTWKYCYGGNGKIVTTQSHPATGYYLYSGPSSGTINNGDVSIVGSYLPITGSVTISKKNAATGEPMTGAVFTVSGTSSVHGSFSVTSTDNGDGTYTVSNIPYGGPYTVKETTAPPGFLTAPDQQVSITTNGQNVALTFEDEPDDPDRKVTLTIGKTIYQSNNQDFPFEVIFKDAGGNPVIIPDDTSVPAEYTVDPVSGVVSFDLRGGETVVLKEIPRHTEATIRETNHLGFQTNVQHNGVTEYNTDTYHLTMDSDQRVDYYNTRRSFMLTLSKTVVGGGAGSFHFEITVRDPVSGAPVIIPQGQGYTVDPVTGVISCTLTDGQKKYISMIPSGASVTVREINHEGYTTEVSLDMGNMESADSCTVVMDQNHSMEFKNTRAAGYKLTITKTVIGSSGSAFPFSLMLKDAGGTPVIIPEDTENPARYTVNSMTGEVVFSLTGGSSLTLPDIPADTSVTITETSHDGYTVLIKDTTAGGTTLSSTDTATIIVTADRAVEVVNNPGVLLPSTGGSGIFPYIGGGAALMLLAVLSGFGLRRSRGRRLK